MQHAIKRALSILLSVSLLTGALAVGQLNGLAQTPTKEEATTAVAMTKENFDAGRFSLAGPALVNGMKISVMRLEENELRYFGNGDWFALKEPVDLAAVRRVSVTYNNVFNWGYVPILVSVFDAENELRAFGLNAAGAEGVFTMPLDSRYAELTGAGIALPETGQLYFSTQCPTQLNVTKIVIEYTDDTTREIVPTADTIDIVTASLPDQEANPGEKYSYYREPVDGATKVEGLWPEAEVTIPNVDLREGLQDIRLSFATLCGPQSPNHPAELWGLWAETDMWMDVYAISKTDSRQYKIGKVTMPAYYKGGYTTPWTEDPAAFEGSFFTWDSEGYRDLFTGVYDIKLVYKSATRARDAYYILLYGAYFYADGAASGQSGADMATTLRTLVANAETIARQEVSSSDEVWNAFQAQLAKTSAYTNDATYDACYPDSTGVPRILGGNFYNMPRLFYHYQALTTAVNALTFYTNDLAGKVQAAKEAYPAQNDYTDATWTALQSAIAAGEEVLRQTEPLPSDVRTAIANLDTATGSMKTYAALLAEQVTAVEAAYPAQEHYTDETWPLLTAAIAAAKTADTTAARKDALAGLERAIAALETYTQLLADAVAQAEADYSAQSHYTDETWTGLTDALAAGKAAQSVVEEKAAIDGLAAAIEALETYTQLLAEAAAQATETYPEQDDYTDESWQTLNDALALSLTAQSPADEKAALEQLAAAIAGMRTYADEVAAAVSQVEADYPTQDLYTDESWQALTAAIAAAKAADTTAARKDALAALATAEQELRSYQDELEDAVRAAQLAYAAQGSYTDETWAALANAIATANNVLAKEDATRQEVTDAIRGLDEAIEGLTSYLDILREAVQQARDTYPAQGDHTDETWTALVNAIAAGEATAADPASTAQQFREALDVLAAAIDGLKTTDGENQTPPTTPTDPDDPDDPADPTDPADPADPADPTDPTDPTDQTDPPPSTPDEEEYPVRTGVTVSLAAVAALILSGGVLWLTRKRRATVRSGRPTV